MSLRTRLAISFAALAAVVAGLMGVLGYTATSNQLERATDQALLAAGGRMERDGPGDRRRGPDAVQLLSADGSVVRSEGGDLPVTASDREVASSAAPTARSRTQSVDGTPFRIVTVSPGGSRGAVMLARDWTEEVTVMRRLAVALAVSALAMAVLAAGVGWLVARQITKRLVRLTDTAERVSATGVLDLDVPTGGTDEVGRLAASFNTMLERLGQSQAEQQRLVQDAGHELRTPLTSLRTNISLLERFEELSPEVRQRVLADLKGESKELTGLVNEVLALAGGQTGDGEPRVVSLSEVAEAVAVRARRRTGREVSVRADDSAVLAAPAALERAVWNLVDNATKFDASASPIEIHVRQGTVEVLDRGPGVAPEEIPHLFDRFYRPVSSRSLPGSGLGLSIVKEVATSNGGSVFVRPRDGGGSVIGFTLPVSG